MSISHLLTPSVVSQHEMQDGDYKDWITIGMLR
jgi:hypothetical protein